MFSFIYDYIDFSLKYRSFHCLIVLSLSLFSCVLLVHPLFSWLESVLFLLSLLLLVLRGDGGHLVVLVVH